MQKDLRLFYIDSIYRKQIHCFSDSERVENICGKGKFTSIFSIFIRPSKTGRIMESPMAGGRPGGRAASTSLSGAYLQNSSSYGYEISWVDRSHQEGVQCAGIITLASLIFQLLPFVFFHT